MTLPTYPSSLALSQIQGEFGGSNPIYLSEYYAGAGRTPSNTLGYPLGVSTNIPTSGNPIKIGNFHGSRWKFDSLVLLTGTGNYTVPSWVTNMDIVIVGGGGGGGSAYGNGHQDGGGGGGGGGVIYLANQTGYAGGTYSYSVGAGGAGGNDSQATSGQNTVFHTYTAIGGGGGGGELGFSTNNPSDPNTKWGRAYLASDGLPGGSGGGGNAYYGTGHGGAGTSGQGYAGGTGAGRPYGTKGDGFNGGGGGCVGPGYNNWPSYGAPGSSTVRYTGGPGNIFSWYSWNLGLTVSTNGVGGGGGAGSGFGIFDGINPDYGVYAWPIGGGGNGALMGQSSGVSGTSITGGGGGGGCGTNTSYGGNGGSGAIYLFMKNY